MYNNIILYKKGLYDSFEFAADNCEKVVNMAGTILFSVLEFAIYMGFKELYLLGVDNSYTLDPEKDKIRNYSEILNGKDIIDGMYYDMSSFSADTHLMEIGYITAKKYADSHGIKIYNATRGGKLEVFPRVDFDKLF